MGGAPYVATTSRSGRIGAGQRELAHLQDTFRQRTPHYNVKVDGSDMAAMADVFQRVQSPMAPNDDLDFFETGISAFEKRAGDVELDEYEEMKQMRQHMADTRQ